MQVQVVPLEFRSFLDRITNSHDYEAAIMGMLYKRHVHDQDTGRI